MSTSSPGRMPALVLAFLFSLSCSRLARAGQPAPTDRETNALAQSTEDVIEPADNSSKEPEMPPDDATGTAPGAKSPQILSGHGTAGGRVVAPSTQAGPTERWSDIVVVQRKEFLKRGRVELVPLVGTTVNDTLIQHTVIGGEINFFLSDVFAVGAQGLYYFKHVNEDEFLIRYNLHRIPGLNTYKFTAAGDFSYVPIYGKFGFFNRSILHYDVWLSAGIGVTGTEIIPRNLVNEPFSNLAITFPVGVGARFFLNKWMALQVWLRDYMMLDKYEAADRNIVDGAEAKKTQSTSAFVNNFIASVGMSFFFPVSFEYTTYR